MSATLKWTIAALVLAGCTPGDAKLLCSLEHQAYFAEYNGYKWIVRRVPSADQLCPK